MRRGLRIASLALALATCSSVFFVGCNGNDNGDKEEKTYQIQYADDVGTHVINVKKGDLYSLESIPKRTGYTFTGLWSTPNGGEKYVNANGTSVEGFAERKNMVLYPQYIVNQYTLVLDYQGAQVNSYRQMTVEYGEIIEELPQSLTYANKTFMGWYTEENRGGIQVADQYGTLPSKNTVTENIFDISDPNGYIYLYAGFKAKEYRVVLNYGNGTTPEELMVEYGTYVKDIVTEKRIDGKAVYSWAINPNATEVFDGKITGITSLYAKEFAPVIDFDTDGGKPVKPVVAKEGEAIWLPTPEKENYAFGGWKKSDGSIVNYTAMPAESTKLTAVWKPMLVFDSRGGTAVENISVNVGEAVTLPTPTREGYIFAGWYTQEGDKYTETAMPSASMKLSAKWYKVKTAKKVFITADTEIKIDNYNNKPKLNKYSSIDLTDIPIAEGDTIKVKGWYKACIQNASMDDPRMGYIGFYSSDTISDAYLLSREEATCTQGTTYARYTFETTWTYATKINACYYGNIKSSYSYGWFTDLYVEIEYPDKTVLL